MTIVHSALLTDLYQLTMLQTYHAERMNETAAFELFVRRLPPERNFLLAAGLARGTSELNGTLDSDDTQAMAGCLRRLGAGVSDLSGSGDLRGSGEEPPAAVEVKGIGGRIGPQRVELDARQSGVTARFMAPLLAVSSGLSSGFQPFLATRSISASLT